MTEISALWDRIEAALTSLGDARQLRPPASAAALMEAEAQLGYALPSDLRESLLRHDGVMPDAWPGFYPMQVANIVKQSRWKSALHREFVLVADGGNGSNLAMSLESGELHFFEGELEGMEYISWAAFLAQVADGLEAGRLVLSPGEFHITELGGGAWVGESEHAVSYRSLEERDE